MPPAGGCSFEERYTLQARVLGAGDGGGVVREATCRNTGRGVAVKAFMKKEMSAKARERLRREVELSRILDHPNVMKVEGVFETEEAVHIVMEQLTGGELFHRLAETGPLPEADAARVTTQLLRGIAYLHAQGVMHRDIKPENVMYQEQGGTQVKLIDFGFSTKIRPGEQLWHCCGSLQYIAPEVVAHRGYDVQADLWSLGCVVSTMLLARLLYEGSKADIVKKTKVGAIDLGEEFDSLSPHAQDFISRLLNVDPDQRPSAEQALGHPWLQQHVPEEVEAAFVEIRERHAVAAKLLEMKKATEVSCWSGMAWSIGEVLLRASFALLQNTSLMAPAVRDLKASLN